MMDESSQAWSTPFHPPLSALIVDTVKQEIISAQAVTGSPPHTWKCENPRKQPGDFHISKATFHNRKNTRKLGVFSLCLSGPMILSQTYFLTYTRCLLIDSLLPANLQNKIIDIFVRNAGIKVSNAFETQGLIELFDQLCSSGSCATCPVMNEPIRTSNHDWKHGHFMAKRNDCFQNRHQYFFCWLFHKT